MADDAAAYESQQIEHQLAEEGGEGVETLQDREARRSYYPSNSGEQPVVNAITGHPYPFAVGSTDSLQLYQVTDATGQSDEQGLRCFRSGSPNYEPNTLYFDSPEQYGHFVGLRLDPEHLEAWRVKVDRLFPYANFYGPIQEDVRANLRDVHQALVAEQLVLARERDQERQTVLCQQVEACATARAEYERNAAYAAAENKSATRVARRAERAVALRARNKLKARAYRQRRTAAKAAKLQAVQVKQARRQRRKVRYEANLAARTAN